MSPGRAAVREIRGRSVGPLVLVGAVLVCVFVAAGGALAATGPGDGGGSGAPVGDESPLAQTAVEADTISLRVTLGAGGSATWRVAYRVELEDENATAAFEDLQADVEADPEPYRQRFRDRMRRTLRGAENATGREMSIENVSVRATRESLPQSEYGVLVYRLNWHGFAVVDGEQLRAGDAIDQFFLDGRQSLTIAWPDEFELASVDPEAASMDDGAVTWQGRRDFGPGEPRVVVAPADAAGGSGGANGSDEGPPLWLVGGGLAALTVLAVAGGWAYRRRSRAAADAPSGAGTAAGGAATADADPPPELLSNEERVLALVDEHGGRMKQKQVAERLDWTAAKTSQVVGDLRDTGDLEAFRLGRENVLTLPGVSIEPGDEIAEIDDADTGDGVDESPDG